MQVIKRDGKLEPIMFDKITKRIKYIVKEIEEYLGRPTKIDTVLIAQRTIASIYDKITTMKLDNISAEIAESMSFNNIDYSLLAARLLVSDLYKNTPPTFTQSIEAITKERPYIFNSNLLEFVKLYGEHLNNIIDPNVDFNKLSYIAIQSYKNVYLIKSVKNENNLDRPQYLLLRVAITLITTGKNYHDPEILNQVRSYYSLLSQQYFIHCTPTLFNSGVKKMQLCSCFLIGTDDSTEEIMRTVSNSATISRYSGGIGIPMHMIRSKKRPFKTSIGCSSGIIPQIKIYNEVAATFDQGGIRPGAFAIYLETWHAEIRDFLRLKLNQGDERMRARDLFYAIWMNNLFMKRLINGKKWSLFSSDNAPGLNKVYDGMEVCANCGGYDNRCLTDCPGFIPEQKDVFTELYEKYEAEGLAIATIDPFEIVTAICKSWRESGIPYICFKDNVNIMSEQKQFGVIESSNLCTEIMQYSDKDNYSTCTLASINLSRFVRHPDKKITSDNVLEFYDFKSLEIAAHNLTLSLNNVIDINWYPGESESMKKFAQKLRPIGIGVQGLAKAFIKLRIPFCSAAAEKLDCAIAESIYYSALSASNQLAKDNKPYETFEKSPMSRGELHFDLWQKITGKEPLFSGLYDWNNLREQIKKYGVYNSLLVAYMPTAGTSKLLDNTESFEPLSGLVYTSTVTHGKYVVICKELVRELEELNLWNENIRHYIIANNSIQDHHDIPKETREVFKTVWEISQFELMKRSQMRGAFIDQSQSLNIYVSDNSDQTLFNILGAAYKLRLKTGSYYIRTKPASRPMKNIIGFDILRPQTENKNESVSSEDKKNMCSLEDKESGACLSCQS